MRSRAIMAPGEGRGWRRNWHRVPCGRCGGSGGGWRPDHCTTCNGTGEVWERVPCSCDARLAVGATVYLHPCGCTGDKNVTATITRLSKTHATLDRAVVLAKCSDVRGRRRFHRGTVHFQWCREVNP